MCGPKDSLHEHFKITLFEGATKDGNNTEKDFNYEERKCKTFDEETGSSLTTPPEDTPAG